MTFLIGLVVGLLTSMLAMLVLRGHNARWLFLNMVVGVSGSLLAAWLVAPASAAAGQQSTALAVVCFLGAFCMLTVFNFLRNRDWRR